MELTESRRILGIRKGMGDLNKGIGKNFGRNSDWQESEEFSRFGKEEENRSESCNFGPTFVPTQVTIGQESSSKTSDFESQ